MDTSSLLLFFLAFAAMAGGIAKLRNRSFIAWFLISIFLSPLISIIILLVIKPGEVETEHEAPETFTYTGEPNTSNDSYNLYLSKQYKIEKNEVLGKFIIGDQSFPDVASALKHAQELDIKQSEIKKSTLKKDGSLSCAKCGGSNVGDTKECRYCKYPLIV